MDYSIKIDEFEGPLDLLLHLIKESNINIWDIKIEDITKQYLDYIEKMEELNIDVASSYLVMAAELTLIKSKSLLPKLNNGEDVVDDEEVSKDNLIYRLTQYQAYKEMADKFKLLEEERQNIIVKSPENINMYASEVSYSNDGNIDDLLSAFKAFIERSKLSKPLNTKITTKEYSVDERNNQIRNILKAKNKVHFTELFDIPSKDYIVVTFLSILDLVKKEEISIKQEYNFEDILLEVRKKDLDE